MSLLHNCCHVVAGPAAAVDTAAIDVINVAQAAVVTVSPCGVTCSLCPSWRVESEYSLHHIIQLALNVVPTSGSMQVGISQVIQ